MRAIRLLLLSVVAMLISVPALAHSQPQPLPPELMRALVSAKSVYIVGGHVQFYRYKHFVKPELVDTTPFDEPCREELEKWGRFKIVPNVTDADLVVRIYMTGSQPAGAYFTVLEIVQPSSKKILWSDSKNDARSWSTKTAVSGLIKKFREFLEQQEKSLQNASPGSPAGVNANPGRQ